MPVVPISSFVNIIEASLNRSSNILKRKINRFEAVINQIKPQIKRILSGNGVRMKNESPSREELLLYTRKHKTKSTSKTAIITELYDDITLAQKEGASLDNIVDFFKTKNIVLSRDYLKNILYRIKKKAKNNHISK